ncbi:MAG: hypothetical protein MJ089_08060 [Ruminococcus sp.]|nr:hypothetical protein [Ruminococcus sp.]
MRIGIDVDGVLTDVYDFYKTCGAKCFNRKPDNLNAYTIDTMFNITKNEKTRFGIKYFLGYYCSKWEPRESAADVIQKLSGENHEVYIITARMFSCDNNPLGWYSKYMLLNWLKKNNIRYNEIIFCPEKNVSENKLSICKSKNIDIMIEDNVDTTALLSENNIKVFLFDAPYNKNILGNNIFRIDKWDNILNKILS